MSIAAKTRIVVAGLTALTIWPLVHVAICARWDASPWKLAGWGMYATPRPRTIGMEVYGSGSAGAASEQLTTPTPALRTEGAAFLDRWRWLGELAEPDAFARLVFETRHDWSRLRIELYRSHLDAASGMVSLHRDDRHYERSADGGAARVAGF